MELSGFSTTAQFLKSTVSASSPNLEKIIAKVRRHGYVKSCTHQVQGTFTTLRNPIIRSEKMPLRFFRRGTLHIEPYIPRKAFILCVTKNELTRLEVEDRDNNTIQDEDRERHMYGKEASLALGSSKKGQTSGINNTEGETAVFSVASREAQDTVTIDHDTGPKRIVFDYGFQAKFLRKGPTVPRNIIKLALENFGREWAALRRSYLFAELEAIEFNKLEGGPLRIASVYLGRGFILFLRGFDKLLQLYDGLPELKPEELETDKEKEELRQALNKLTLSDDAVWERERSRPPVEAPWWILGPYYALCLMLDVIFKGRPIQRFWFLETVARMPYFSYISMLHLYETLGWWRTGAEVRKVHFAEEWNEMHHLKIMESLGGDLQWGDRFFAQHAAFFYYWILNFMFMTSPKVAYNFSELIEMHAVDTYSQFVDENKELLIRLPPPPAAVDYYESEDLYMYDEFQTSHLPETRRPKVDNLFDVFTAITGDEYEHVKTMVACQQLDTLVVSPHMAKVRGPKLHD